MKNATKTTKKAATKAASSNAVIAAQTANETKPMADLGPNAKFPFAIKITDGGNISFERFKTEKELNRRYGTWARTPKGEGQTVEVVKYTAPAPAEKPAPTKKAAAKKTAAPKAASTELEVHINPSGRVCFGKLAAARIGDMGFMTITHEGKVLRMVATNRETETPIRRASGRPYISATKELKAAGLFNDEAADLVPQPYNHHGFDFKAKAAPAPEAAA
jgi:hypothetical protein